MMVGEAPGATEDAQGRPFVGSAGRLLNKLLHALGLRRKDVYVANVLCCRPDVSPGEPNRPPRGFEINECLPYLYAQISIVQPWVIVAMGAIAIEALAPEYGLWTHGTVYEFKGIPVVPTYHPSYVLRNPTKQVRANLWIHFLTAIEKAGWPIQDLADRVPTARDLCE